MRRFISLLLCCLLVLAGCGKTELKEFKTDVEPHGPIQLEPPLNEIKPIYEDDIKPIDEIETKSIEQEHIMPVEEESVETEDGLVELDVSEYQELEIPINPLRPLEVDMFICNANIKMGVDTAFGNTYIDMLGNKFVYQDGVNYTCIGRQYHKWEGPDVLSDSEEDTISMGTLTGVESDESIILVDNYRALTNGKEINVDGYIESDGEKIPATAIIDSKNHELITLNIEDEASNVYVTINALDMWNPLPDVEFDSVDRETIEADAETVMMGLFSIMLTGAMAELGNTEIYEESFETLE